jgi:tetratricopeptide (TPR) repeat protein
VVSSDFVFYDDPDYVTDNAHVRQGLSWSNIGWAFTTNAAGNWHPITWLSHMLDVQLFENQASMHHLVNLALHIASSVVLLLALERMTGAFWRSTFVAALFALHPMHVESVAWVAERKDVLSGLFFMLTLWGYTEYVRRVEDRGSVENDERNPKPQIPSLPGPSPKASTFHLRASACYLLAVALFALGLMSKPMLVTLPFVLLLLDYWPLRRFQLSTLWPLLREKLPFFLLAAISSTLTFRAQLGKGALEMIPDLSLGARIGNALVSYCRYLGKLVWPVQLSVFYPHPGHWPIRVVALAALLLLVISALAWVLRRRQPSLIVGWLWFLGTLVPVIGFVQAGSQAMADRYTYLPYVGLFIGIAWLNWERLSVSVPRPQVALFLPAISFLTALALLTWKQTGYWRTTRVLFEHAVAVTPDSEVAQNNLAGCLMMAGENAAAEAHYREAARLQPGSRMTLENLAKCISPDPQRRSEAAELYQRALKAGGTASTHYNFACLLLQKGELAEAESHLLTALQMKPDYVQARFNLGVLKHQQRKYDEAAQAMEAVLELQPAFAPAQLELGAILVEQQKWDQAIVHLKAGLQNMPDHLEGRRALGIALVAQGRFSEALPELQIALQGGPDARTHYNLGLAHHGLDQFDDALAYYREAVRLAPDVPDYLNDLAWLLATCPKAELRNGDEAVRLAEKACRLSGDKDARFWGTLDAAYAEAGRFEEAAATARRTRELASAAGQKDIAEAAEKRLQLYDSHQPYRP